MKTIFTAFVSGVVFALGLGLGGFTQPARVQGFLDFFGDWDPRLGLVMAVACGTYFLSLHLLVANHPPSTGLPIRAPVSEWARHLRLVAGSVVFGVGWGLGGLDPAPAVTALVAGAHGHLAFLAAMSAGMVGMEVVDTLAMKRAELPGRETAPR